MNAPTRHSRPNCFTKPPRPTTRRDPRHGGLRRLLSVVPTGLCAALVGSSLFWVPTASSAQVPADAVNRVDEIFSRWDGNTSPGCAVGVVSNGLTLMERAYGMADLEHGIANTPATIFEGGSLSKQFTAAAVMLLVLDGELDLEDDIRTYVPEVPDYGETITLHRLMTHTSGLRDWGSVASISGWGREQRSHDHDDVIDILSRQTALNFVPGHEYSYSNSGYNLLAVVVARVSGMPFAEFSRTRIFEPLGLRSTRWRDDYRRIVPGRSSAYSRTMDGWEINRPIEDVHGNGGILTTVGDLGIWNEALSDGRLGGAEFVALMHRQGRLNDDSEITYAGGLQVSTLGGVPSVTHTGATAGYRAFAGRYPEQGLSVSMLCNASDVPTGGTGARVASVFLGGAATARRQISPEHDPEPGELQRYSGLFRDPVTGSTRVLRVEGGVLFDASTTLVPLGGARFQVGLGPRRYDFAEGNPSPSFSVADWQYTDQKYERVDPWRPSPADLRDLAGTYHSPEAETTFVVSVDGRTVSVWRRPNDTARATPIYRDAFRLDGGRIIRFRRDAGGSVTGLSLSLGRVYDMRFERGSG